MKAIVQRSRGLTSIAAKKTDGQMSKGEFQGPGLVVLLGWSRSDEVRGDLDKAEDWILSRIRGLRVFPDAQEKMNLSLSQYCVENAITSAGILWVSQFTLDAQLESGFRPSFIEAMNPEMAKLRFENFKKKVIDFDATSESPFPTENFKQIFGDFGADMTLTFSNWGPVTIPLER
jgi:D-tyrosyl-tRNA(Tyr) deacylase